MTIDQINVYVLSVKLGFQYSVGLLETSYVLVWELIAGRYRGYGECGWASGFAAPLEYSGTGSSGTSTLLSHQIQEALLPPAERAFLEEWAGPLLGRDPLLLGGLLPELPGVYEDRALFLRDGLSIGLYDLAGHILHAPVHVLLGGKRRRRAPGMPVIHVAPPEVMERRALAWVRDGYGFLKLKLSGEREADRERVRAVRQAVGPDIRLQVDANEGYTRLSQAERAILDLQPFDVDYFEDMLNAPLADIARLRQRTGARIMVDREAYWPNVYDVCRSGAADLINHHPNLQGGLDTALRIDAVALAAGIPTAVGSSGIVGIQNAAYQTLSSVIGVTRPCEDIGLLPYYNGPTRGEYAMDAAPSVVQRPYDISSGLIQIPDAPGIGIIPNRRRLEHFTVDMLELKN